MRMARAIGAIKVRSSWRNGCDMAYSSIVEWAGR